MKERLVFCPNALLQKMRVGQNKTDSILYPLVFVKPNLLYRVYALTG